ncbi:MAG: amino acid permease, partial [Acidobacteria bacterium]|nr:amino acid permease [Acidobacteriota bacterium]
VPKTMILQLGSPGLVFAVWIFGGLLTLAGALSYAELAAALPRAGGDYVYLKEAYGPFWGFVYGWTVMWVAKSGSIATLATAFFLYLGNFYPSLESVLFSIPLPIGPHGGPLEIRSGQLLAMAIIFLLALLNYFGIRLGGNVQIVITVVKVALIAAIIVIGLTSTAGSLANYRSSIPAPSGVAGFFAALVAALWAYDGWNNLNMIGSEIRNPQRNFPLALIFGTLAVVTIYLATNAAYFYVLDAQSVGGSSRVASEMMNRILGARGASAVSVAAMISILAALNGSILSGSRVPYAMAHDGYFFRRVAGVNEKYRTPGVSIFLISGWAAVLVLSGRYEDLFNLVIFSSWILYGMSAAAVIVLRYKQPDLHRPYRTLGYPVVSVLFVLVAVLLLSVTLVKSPRESGLGLALILAGVPFYLYWKKRRV